MKIAIPTNNKKGLKDPVAEHFGRAKNTTRKQKLLIFIRIPKSQGRQSFLPIFYIARK